MRKNKSSFLGEYRNLIKQGHSKKEAYRIAKRQVKQNRSSLNDKGFYEDIDSSDHLFDHYNNSGLPSGFLGDVVAILITPFILIAMLLRWISEKIRMLFGGRS